VFVPKHPVTRPKLDDIVESELKADMEPLIADAVEKAETLVIE